LTANPKASSTHRAIGRLLPRRFGNIEQQILGRSIAAEIALHNQETGEVIRENAAMKRLAVQLDS
jgi:hypothetical protein